jgi:hypothetical protein
MSNEFDLEQAIAGEPIETEDGTPAEFIAYRPTTDKNEQVIAQVGTNILTYHTNGRYYGQYIESSLDLRMKLVAKQIDWSKMPVDTLIILGIYAGGDKRYFSSFTSGLVHCYRFGMTSKTATSNSDVFTMNPNNVQIAPDQPWTIWQGGDCPIPDGLEFEYMINDDPGQVMVGKESASAYLCLWHPKVIYAYRLTGKVLDRWAL